MQLTPEGTNAGRLSSETLCSAVNQVRSNGLVLFERVLKAHPLADPNRGATRYPMHVPFARPFCDDRVIASPFVPPIVEALLGQDCIGHYFYGAH